MTGANLPEDKYMVVYPSVATVKFRCEFPYNADVAADVNFHIDYADFLNSRSGKCIVRTNDLPPGVIGYSIEPEIFDCVVNDR